MYNTVVKGPEVIISFLAHVKTMPLTLPTIFLTFMLDVTFYIVTMWQITKHY